MSKYRFISLPLFLIILFFISLKNINGAEISPLLIDDFGKLKSYSVKIKSTNQSKYEKLKIQVNGLIDSIEVFVKKGKELSDTEKRELDSRIVDIKEEINKANSDKKKSIDIQQKAFLDIRPSLDLHIHFFENLDIASTIREWNKSDEESKNFFIQKLEDKKWN